MSATSELATDHVIRMLRESCDPKLKEMLVKRHLPLVRHIASAFSNRGESDDLIQVGCIGLLRAIERFDPEHGKPFEAYASTLIKGEIQHYLRDYSSLVRPPRELVELRKQVNDSIERFSGTVPPPELVERVAAETGLSVEKVSAVRELEVAVHPVSLDDQGDEFDAPRYQLIDQKYKSFQLAAEDRIMLAQATARLREVSREVIEFAFYQDLSQTEMSKKLGISQMQVSRRLKSAVQELWKVLNSRLW